jgi:hypothetical protein
MRNLFATASAPRSSVSIAIFCASMTSFDVIGDLIAAIA